MIIRDLLCSNVISRYIHHLMHPAFEKNRECKYVGGLSGTIHLSGGGAYGDCRSVVFSRLTLIS